MLTKKDMCFFKILLVILEEKEYNFFRGWIRFMKKASYFTQVESLEEVMQYVQANERFKMEGKQLDKKKAKNNRLLIMGMVPFLLGFITTIVSLHSFFVIGGTTVFIGIGSFKLWQDIKIKKEFKQLIEQIEEETFKDDMEMDKTSLLEKENIFSVVGKKEKYFVNASKDIVKYCSDNFVLEKELPDEEEREVTLTKEETIQKIKEEYYLYASLYSLPKQNISFKEFQSLFDVLYERLKELEIEEEYYSCMHFLLQCVLSYALLYKETRITIASYIKQLEMLCVLEFSEEDVESIKEDLLKRLQDNRALEVIDFVESKNHLKKKKK